MYEILKQQVLNSEGTKTSKIAGHSKSETLTLRADKLILYKDGMFHYFRLKLVDPSPDSLFLTMERAPHHLVEGFATHNKRIYRVSVRDILKGRVRKSSVISKGDLLNDIYPGRDTQPTDGVGTTGIQHTDRTDQQEFAEGVRREDELGISEADEAKELEEANLYHSQQIGALYNSEDSQEIV